jgi:uncharacterized FlaG/YvyC family protein
MVEKIDGQLVYTQVNISQLQNISDQREKIIEAQKKITENVEELNKSEQLPKPGDLTKLIDEPIDAIKEMNVKRMYDVDDLLNLIIAFILNPDTNELVRQIPPKVSVDIAKYLSEYLGTNVNTEA